MAKTKGKFIEDEWLKRFSEDGYELGVVTAFLAALKLANHWPHDAELDTTLHRCLRAVRAAETSLSAAYHKHLRVHDKTS